MKHSSFALLFVAASAAVLCADSQRTLPASFQDGSILHASFPDGTGLEIFSQTTGSSQIDVVGEMGIGPGVTSQDLVNRVVRDKAGNILFAYNLEASRGAAPNTVMIRIEPISPVMEAEIIKRKASEGKPFPGAHLPTVSGVREFAAVNVGEAVALDIMLNPSTGEKIFDVLRPIAGSISHFSVSAVPAPETISLKNIAIRVNGLTMAAPASWIIGSAVRIDIPHHGTYVVAAFDPHQSSPDHAFAAIAHADGKTLSWTMGRDRVEITSSTNISKRPGQDVLWVYHDRHYQPDVVGLQAAETVDWLLPKR